MEINEDQAHKGLAALDPARAEAPTKPSTKARHNKPVVQPWQMCSKKDIKPYKKYRVLYGERKFAQEFAEQKQTLSFTDDLPTEVRLRIYDFLFKTPGDYFELGDPPHRTEGEEKWQNLYRKYASNKKALGIMRLSKKIREEVADYFYGRLNIRFTNSWNGFLAMTAFHYTIGPMNRNFIRHVTVGMPDSTLCSGTLGGWYHFERVMESRGMRTPCIGYREKKRSRGYTEAQRIHDVTARRGFRQLGNMAGLKLLEILIPWNHFDFFSIVYTGNWRPTMVACGCGKDFQSLSPEDQICHVVEDHTRQKDFWVLLAGLKQQPCSEELTIALIYDYASTSFTPDSEYIEDHILDSDISNPLRIGRWVAAYASVMGYKFGYARPAKKGAYKVRYDQDILMSKSLERLKDDPLQYDPLLEPPKLSG